MDFSQFFDYDGQTVKRSESDFVFLADLPADDWQHILDVTQRYGFAAGDVVIRQGEVSSALYIVASGELDVILIGDNGTTRPISRIDPLSVFGEQAFFDGLPRSATVRARTASELHMLTHEAFDALAARYPDLARKILFDLGRIVSLRLRAMTFLASR
jgi:CRP/FNR family cyclic AMP-dependent transcriptional regulator